MTSRGTVAPYLIGAVIGAMVLTAGMPDGAHAEQVDRAAAGKSSKAAAAKKSGAAEPQRQPWSLEDALPRRQTDAVRPRGADMPSASAPLLGRIPLEQGSFGFTTETKVKSNEFGDGRRVPGLETIKRQEPSYFGLSLTVPNNDKSILPVPLLSQW